MGWQLSHAAPGRRLSSPHSCWPIWNGGARTTILCDLTTLCAWRSCSHESEGADCSRNAIGNGRQPWQRGGPIDDGRLARSSRAPCRRLLLESGPSQMRVECQVARKLGKVPAEALGCSPAREEATCPDSSLTKKPPRSGFAEADRIIHYIQYLYPLWQVFQNT